MRREGKTQLLAPDMSEATRRLVADGRSTPPHLSLAAGVTAAVAIVALMVGIAIFSDVHGWAKWGLGMVWGLNVVVAGRLAWSYYLLRAPVSDQHPMSS